MSARYCAWMNIGGRIERSKIGPLLEEISQSGVKLSWGEPFFEPQTAEELLDGRENGWLSLCDDEARYGEFPRFEETCRKLGLGYRRYCEAWCGYDAEIVDWRPGLEEPLIRTCSNEDSNIVLVDGDTVREALTALQAGDIPEAADKLRSLCPVILDLPSFEIV